MERIPRRKICDEEQKQMFSEIRERPVYLGGSRNVLTAKKVLHKFMLGETVLALQFSQIQIKKHFSSFIM